VGVPCGLACAYCITGARRRQAHALQSTGWRGRFRPRRRPWQMRVDPYVQTARSTRDILDALEALLGNTPAATPLEITADDLLEFSGLLDLFALHQRFGRPLRVITPGLRLADEAFVAACARYPVAFTLTLPSASPAVTDGLLGRAGAHRAILRALHLLRRHRLEHSLNCVVTRDNVGGLADLARLAVDDLHLKGLALPLFYPEQVLVDLAPERWQLHPPLPRLSAQLERILDHIAGRDFRLTLVDVPPCQVSARVADSPQVHWTFVRHTDAPTPRRRLPACASCPRDPECGHLPAPPPVPRAG